MRRIANRRWALAALLCGVAFGAAEAAAQVDVHAGIASDQIGDVPSGSAMLEVVVRMRADGAPAADLEVSLFALSPDGRPGIRRAATDGNGSVRFEGIANDPAAVYLVGVRFDDVPFGARASFAPGADEVVAAIEVAERSEDGGVLQPGAFVLRVDPGCSGLRIHETHALSNPGDHVLYLPPDDRASAEPLLRIPLPAGATGFLSASSAFDDRLEQRGDEVLVHGPLYPGDNSVSFSYALPTTGETLGLERRLPLGAPEAAVLTGPDAEPARGPALSPAADVDVDGVTYRSVTAGPIAPGRALAFEISAGRPAEQFGRVAISDVRTWLELDDAALDVREQYSLRVTGGALPGSVSGSPLLCLALPEGAEGLRFSQEAFAMGVQPDASGGVSLRGPLPDGESVIALSYIVPSAPTGTSYRQRFAADVPLLTLYIADTGVVTDTARLHRRRPIRTSDRSYLHLEGFEIAAGEPVSVKLLPIEAPGRLPRAAGVGFVASAALLVAGLLLTPLRRPAAALAETAASTLDAERQAVVQALRDLDDDFETGKISADDHRAMRGELRAQVAALLRAERAAPAEAVPGTAAASCDRCGVRAADDARFCSQCGAALAAAEGSGAPAA